MHLNEIKHICAKYLMPINTTVMKRVCGICSYSAIQQIHKDIGVKLALGVISVTEKISIYGNCHVLKHLCGQLVNPLLLKQYLFVKGRMLDNA